MKVTQANSAADSQFGDTASELAFVSLPLPSRSIPRRSHSTFSYTRVHLSLTLPPYGIGSSLAPHLNRPARASPLTQHLPLPYMSAAASTSGHSAVSGLGISFNPSPPAPIYHEPRNNEQEERVVQHSQRHPRTLHHSISYDEGLSRSVHRYSQPMIKSDSSDSNGHRRVRIAAGTPEVLGKQPQHHGMYQQPHHNLSPLSEFEHSESDSAMEYSPASFASVPSSANSPYAHQFPQPGGQLRHAQSMQEIYYNPYVDPYADPYSAPPMEYTNSRPYIPQPHPQQHVSYHRPHPVLEEEQEQPAPTSRLPAFLQDRRRQPSLARPKSMLELGQLQAQQSIQQYSQAPELIHSYHYPSASSHGHQALAEEEQEQEVEEEASDDDRYGVGSPSESVPSSAGGLQRRNLERQLQQQHRFYQEEKARLHKSAAERHVPSYPAGARPPARMRSRSMCATDRVPRPSAEEEEEECAEAQDEQEPPQAARPKSEVVAMRSQAAMRGLEPAETGGSFVTLNRDGYAEGEDISPQGTSESMRNGEEQVVREEDVVADARSTAAGSTASSGVSSLARHSTLLTVGANPVRRSRELDRLLAPGGKPALPSLPTIADSPKLSSTSGASAATRQRASSHASSHPSTVDALSTSPVMLEQGKAASKARVELDVVLESTLVVEGGTLKGRIEVRVRKPKAMESEVWVGRPKVRVVGFEGELRGPALACLSLTLLRAQNSPRKTLATSSTITPVPSPRSMAYRVPRPPLFLASSRPPTPRASTRLDSASMSFPLACTFPSARAQRVDGRASRAWSATLSSGESRCLLTLARASADPLSPPQLHQAQVGERQGPLHRPLLPSRRDLPLLQSCGPSRSGSQTTRSQRL